MINLDNLNEEQKEAVLTTDGYIRVIASPGSGKTRALTHRYAHLVKDLNVKSNNILCITYTNKAANEMKQRIINLLDYSCDFTNISTIHSYCDRFLRKYLGSLKYKINSNYTILSEIEQNSIYSKFVREKNIYNGDKLCKPPVIEKLISKIKRYYPDYIQYVFGITNKVNLQEINRLIEKYNVDNLNLKAEDLVQLFDIGKNANGLFFDDLVQGTLFILSTNNDILNRESRNFKYVLIDEFQDTTPNTYQIACLLSSYNKNLFVVGDPDQSIYEFIGADPNLLIKTFIKDFPSAKTIFMNTNYRSTKNIIDLSNSLIDLNKNRNAEKKTVSAFDNQGAKCVRGRYKKNQKKEQYYDACRIIKQLIEKESYEYRDFFIIGRNNYNLMNIKKYLKDYDIPYTYGRKLNRLTEQDPIQLIICALNFALTNSPFAISKINDIVSLDISKENIERIYNLNNDTDKILEEIAKTNNKVKKLMDQNNRLKKLLMDAKITVSQIVESTIMIYEILQLYPAPENMGERWIEAEYISEFITRIQENEKLNQSYRIFDLLDTISLDSTIESPSETKDAVILLTAHSSKGLENKNVIIIDYQDIEYDYPINSDAYPEEILNRIEGERRLAYVAFTRAKENLFIFSADDNYYSNSVINDKCISALEKLTNINSLDINQIILNLKDGLGVEQMKGFDILISSNNVFLTGEAGTGKTYLLNRYLKYLSIMNKSVLICAPTGIAAANYPTGTTIHKAFGILPIPSIISPKEIVNPIVEDIDTIIIDEISMVRIDIFEYIIRTIEDFQKIHNKNIQLIVCGDFFQLPPVILDKERAILNQLFPGFVEGFAFESLLWKERNFKNICLKEIHRQKDSEFISALNNVRKGINVVESIKYINEHACKQRIEGALEIHATNSRVNSINISNLNKLPTETFKFSYHLNDVITDDLRIEPVIEVKVGCRVMILVNNDYLNYQNGTLGTIINCYYNKEEECGYVDVILDNSNAIVRIDQFEYKCLSDIVLKPDNTIEQHVIGEIWQIPIKLAYAMTIHKSQGSTYDKVNLDPNGWENGQVYVALSRIKSIDGLFLYNEIKPEVIMTSQNVIEFYKEVEKTNSI